MMVCSQALNFPNPTLKLAHRKITSDSPHNITHPKLTSTNVKTRLQAFQSYLIQKRNPCELLMDAWSRGKSKLYNIFEW